MPAIENAIQTNASEIAKQFGLTKGTISQTLFRLKKKGIITKIKDSKVHSGFDFKSSNLQIRTLNHRVGNTYTYLKNVI